MYCSGQGQIAWGQTPRAPNRQETFCRFRSRICGGIIMRPWCCRRLRKCITNQKVARKRRTSRSCCRIRIQWTPSCAPSTLSKHCKLRISREFQRFRQNRKRSSPRQLCRKTSSKWRRSSWRATIRKVSGMSYQHASRKNSYSISSGKESRNCWRETSKLLISSTEMTHSIWNPKYRILLTKSKGRTQAEREVPTMCQVRRWPQTMIRREQQIKSQSNDSTQTQRLEFPVQAAPTTAWVHTSPLPIRPLSERREVLRTTLKTSSRGLTQEWPTVK